MKTEEAVELAQTLFEEIGDAVFIVEPDTGRVTDVNPMAERLTELSYEELLGLPLSELLHPHANGGLSRLQRALYTTQTFHSQEGFLLRRGRGDAWTPVNITLTRLHTELRPLGLILARDITERKQAEDKLRLANAELEGRVQERTADLARINEALRAKIVEHERAQEALKDAMSQLRFLNDMVTQSTQPFAVVDLQGRLVRFNPAFERLTGYGREELLKLTYRNLTPEHRHGMEDEQVARVLGTGQAVRYEKEYLRQDGTLIPVELVVDAYPNAVGDPEYLCAFIMDISERKRAEERIRAAEGRFRILVEQSLLGLYIIQDNRYVYVNPKMEEILGCSSEELTSRSVFDFITDEDRDLARENIRKRMEGTVPDVRYQLRMLHRDGHILKVEVHGRKSEFDGRPAIIGVLLDVTEQRLLEEQFRQAQKMEAVGKLAGGVAHDFNNLLTVILGYSDIVMSQLEPVDPMRGLIEQIYKSGERASQLTRQLLAFSRKQVLQPVVLDLNMLMTDMEKMLRRLIGEDIELQVSAASELRFVKADVGQMEQVVMNIVINARDAMPHGGKITIEAANVDLDADYAIHHAGMQSGPHVRLAVSDTGCGMDAATKARIFEPFFSTKGDRGTGLGLATVFGIVKQSGGHIEVYSELGVGTTFKIYLQRYVADQATSKSRPGQQSPRKGTETILLAEDENDVRNLTAMILRNQGYTVVEARNGGEAFLYCEQSNVPIHLLITDVVMPKMSGRQLAERLAPVRPEMKVLYLSGYTDDAIVHHGVLEAGVAFLNKPFSSDLLARKVREVLDA